MWILMNMGPLKVSLFCSLEDSFLKDLNAHSPTEPDSFFLLAEQHELKFSNFDRRKIKMSDDIIGK